MKKFMFFLCIFLILVTSAVFAIFLSKEQKIVLRTCQVNCSSENKASLNACKELNTLCLNTCKEEFAQCLNQIESTKTNCNLACVQGYETVVNQTSNQTQIRAANIELLSCKKTCTVDARESRKNDCNSATCKKSCTQDRRECMTISKDNHLACKLACYVYILNESSISNQTNDNSTLNLNETILLNETSGGNQTTLDFNETILLNETGNGIQTTLDFNETIPLNETTGGNVRADNDPQTNETGTPGFNNSCVGSFRDGACAAV